MILVDPAVWPWRDRYWAHLASDAGDAELHEFAARLGLRRMAFQGDHYDVDESNRRRALHAGARPVAARELVRRLRATGRRRVGSRQALRWQVLGEWPLTDPGASPPLGAAAEQLPAGALASLLQAGRAMAADDVVLRLLARRGEIAAVLALAGCDLPLPVPEIVVVHPPAPAIV